MISGVAAKVKIHVVRLLKKIERETWEVKESPLKENILQGTLILIYYVIMGVEKLLNLNFRMGKFVVAKAKICVLK